MKDPVKIEQRPEAATLTDYLRYVRYFRSAEWLIEREMQLREPWEEMCARVLPKLRKKPLTRHCVQQLSEGGHGMGKTAVHGFVHGRPVTREHSLPEDWRLSFYLGRHVLFGENSISKVAVVGFSEPVQARQSKKLRHLNGLTSTVGKKKLEHIRNRDLREDRVRSIWVGRLERLADRSWQKGHVKVRNPSMWPQELMSETALARLQEELADHPTAPDDPATYLEQTYGTQEVIDAQARSIHLLDAWAQVDFDGYLSSETPPRIMRSRIDLPPEPNGRIIPGFPER